MAESTAIYNEQNLSSNTDRAGSPAIWGSCPWGSIQNGKVPGIAYYDDFTDLPLPPTLTTQIAYGKYKAFGDTGNTLKKVGSVNSALVPGGALEMALDTDNDVCAIAQQVGAFNLTNSKSTSGKLWFECCYAQNSIATNMAAVMFGLAETSLWTLTTTCPFNDADAIDASAAFIGFRIEEDGLGVVDTVYSDRATSFTNIGDTEGGTLVANTFKKFGFVYDLDATAANRIVFYADNQPLTTRLTSSALSALTYLDAGTLGLIWASCADSAGTSFKGYMKWWRVAQLMPN